MDNNLNYIDEMVSSSLTDYKVPAEYNDWEMMSRRMQTPVKEIIIKYLVGIAGVALVVFIVAKTISSYNMPEKNNSMLIVNETKNNTENPIQLNEIDDEKTITFSPDSKNKPIIDNLQITKNNIQDADTNYPVRNLADFNYIKNKDYSDVITKSKYDWKQTGKRALKNELFEENIHTQIKHSAEHSAEHNASLYEGCAPLTIHFKAEIDNADSYSWNFGNGYSSTNENPTITYYQPGTYIVNFDAVDSSGKKHAHTDTVIVNEAPDARFELSADTAKIPGKATKFKSYAKTSDKVLWNFGDGNYSNEPVAYHKYQQTGNFNISLMIWNSKNCFDSTTVFDAVCVVNAGSIRFPNAFTPNTDGPASSYYKTENHNNSVFFPYSYGVEQYQLIIYNRNGMVVFETKDINKGWNGYYKDKLCKQDIYVWFVKGRYTNGEPFTMRGDVMLLQQ